IQSHLKPSGVLVVNVIGSFAPKEDFLAASLDQTLRTVFEDVRIHYSGNGNLFYVASLQPLVVHHEPLFADMPVELDDATQRAWASRGVTEQANGMVLTDDYNPIEYFDAKSREALRRNLVKLINRNG
ncbi:MAG: spermidine synthase, partial [Dehalococcoidia bacterium]